MTERETHTLIRTRAALADALGFAPMPYDAPSSLHRSFAKVTKDYSAILFIRTAQSHGCQSVTLKIYPGFEESQQEADTSLITIEQAFEGQPSRNYELHRRFAEQLTEVLGESGEFDRDALRNGGYDKLRDLIDHLIATGEVEGVARWLAFERDFPLEFTPESLERLVGKISELPGFEPDGTQQVHEVNQTFVESPEGFAHSIGFHPVECSDPDPKWHCYTRDMGTYHLQLLIEDLMYSAGIRIYLRELAEDESLGSLQLGGDNIGSYLYQAIHSRYGAVIEPFGKFDKDWLAQGGYSIVAELMRELEQSGLLDGLHRSKEFYHQYQNDPLRFQREVVPYLVSKF